eukprot:UN09924
MIEWICSNNTNDDFIKHVLEASIKHDVNIIFMLQFIVKSYPKQGNFDDKYQVALTRLRHCVFEKACKRFQFTFKTSFPAKPYTVYKNQHALYHISNIPQTDGKHPRSL